MNDIRLNMITEFLCPGCMNGPAGTDCPKYEVKSHPNGFFGCGGHQAGTIIAGAGSINLGMPTGFNKVGCAFPHGMNNEDKTDNIRLREGMDPSEWDKFNVPVWVMEQQGFLFIRTYVPRTNRTFVDVVAGGKVADLPQTTGPIDVGEFVEEID